MERLLRQLLPTFNTDLLITEVRERPLIWDKRQEEYSDKLMRSEAWKEVARQFASDFDEIQAEKQAIIVKELSRKWKNLRQCYKRERDSLRKLGAERYKKKTQYVNFNVLSFLSPIFDMTSTEDELNQSVQSSVTRPPKIKRNTENSEVDKLQTIEKSVENKIESKPNQFVKTPPTFGSRPKRKHDTGNPDACYIVKKSSEDKSVKRKKERVEEDGDKQFLMSLLNYIRPVSGINKLNLRSELLAVVTKYYNVSVQQPQSLPYFGQNYQNPIPFQQPMQALPVQPQYTQPSPSLSVPSPTSYSESSSNSMAQGALSSSSSVISINDLDSHFQD